MHPLNSNPNQVDSFAVTQYDDLWSRNYITKVSDDVLDDMAIDLPIYRHKSQYLCEATQIAFSPIQNATSLIIGKDLHCTPQPKLKDLSRTKAVRDALLDYWTNYTSACHLNGQDDLPTILRAILASSYRDGDILAYISANAKGELKPDLVAANRIETPPKDQIPQGKSVRLGVQYGENEEIEGYWVRSGGRRSKKTYSFFPCFEDGRIKSVLLKNANSVARVGLPRGIPVYAPVISTIENLSAILKAELKATVSKTNQIAVLKSHLMDAKSLVDQAIDAARNALLKSIFKTGDTNIVAMGTMDSFEMSKAGDISNPQLASHVQTYLEQIAGVFGISWNVLYGVMQDSSYSTNQTLKMSAWETGEIHRSYLVRNFVKPLYELVMEKAIREGKIEGIKPNEFHKDLLRVEFIGKANFQLRQKDIFESQEIAIKSGQKSIVQVCNENGLDAYTILEEKLNYIAEMKKMMKERELSPEDLLLGEDSVKLNAVNSVQENK